METLLRIFSFRSATVHEEAMLAVGSFSYAVGRQFVKYLPQFSQYLKTGLTNYLEWQVCAVHPHVLPLPGWITSARHFHFSSNHLICFILL